MIPEYNYRISHIHNAWLVHLAYRNDKRKFSQWENGKISEIFISVVLSKNRPGDNVIPPTMERLNNIKDNEKDKY